MSDLLGQDSDDSPPGRVNLGMDLESRDFQPSSTYVRETSVQSDAKMNLNPKQIYRRKRSGSLDNGNLGFKLYQYENSNLKPLDSAKNGGNPRNDEEEGPSSDDFEDLSNQGDSRLERAFNAVQERFGRTILRHKRVISYLSMITLVLLYNAYFIGAIWYNRDKDLPWDWCGGTGLLIILTVLTYTGVFYFKVVKPYLSEPLSIAFLPAVRVFNRVSSKPMFQYAAYGTVISIICLFIIVDTWNEQERLVSALGALLLLLFGFVFSEHPGKVRWRHVIWGMGLQFVFGLLILRWEVGKSIFKCIGDKVSTFLGYTDSGSGFVYGYLVDGSPLGEGGSPFPTIFAFKVLSVIFFFSFCINILYYYGIMQWVVIKVGWLLQISVGTTAAESMNAAANIFVGQTEAPILIKPYLSLMTKSELHAVMTGGFATIAGTVLAAYIDFGVDPAHLLSASVMSAPAALAYAKLFYPETKKTRTSVEDIKIEKGSEANALDAAATGASNAISLVANICANLIAFISFVAFLNAVVEWLCLLVGWEGVTFEFLVGRIFMPLAWCLGVPWKDCGKVGELIGLKTVVNEFVAYAKLQEFTEAQAISERSIVISTYALCGFSNLASVGVQLGGLGAMAPERRSDLSKVVFRALIAGSMACFLTACIAAEELLVAKELRRPSGTNANHLDSLEDNSLWRRGHHAKERETSPFFYKLRRQVRSSLNLLSQWDFLKKLYTFITVDDTIRINHNRDISLMNCKLEIGPKLSNGSKWIDPTAQGWTLGWASFVPMVAAAMS
ncbi:unnamed protein product [Cyprideis torosa]|uniref:Sodium/nucleoside cotransporter n=1 Tax=Cyprideis torosa TaxID=163714 RepID=A0A7R8ZNH7_9CRUS|nr:unnamed protein product [Cyprideis torosa]CAG0891607.1 unnamed protein product [Cyprideis torosa]